MSAAEKTRTVEPKRRLPRAAPWLAALGIAATLALGGWGYVRWANELPPPDPEPKTAPLPSPNGFDACSAAAVKIQLNAGERGQSAPRDMKALRAFVRRDAANRDELRRALKLPYRTPQRREEVDEDAMRPYRQAARSFQAEARLARLEGRPDEAIRSVLDAMELGRNVQLGGPLIHQIVGSAIFAIALSEGERIAPLLSAKAARAAGLRMDGILTTMAPTPEVLEEERRYFLSIVRQGLNSPAESRSEEAQRSPVSRVDEWVTTTLYPRRRSYRAADRFYKRLIEEARKPWPARRPVDPGFDPWVKEISGVLHRALDSETGIRANLRLVRVMLALRERQAQTGSLPQSLAALSSTSLKATPADPFTEQPFRYRRQGADYLLYSIGEDGRDNGGQPPLRKGSRIGDRVAGRLYPSGR